MFSEYSGYYLFGETGQIRINDFSGDIRKNDVIVNVRRSKDRILIEIRGACIYQEDDINRLPLLQIKIYYHIPFYRFESIDRQITITPFCENYNLFRAKKVSDEELANISRSSGYNTGFSALDHNWRIVLDRDEIIHSEIFEYLRTSNDLPDEYVKALADIQKRFCEDDLASFIKWIHKN